MDKRTVQIAAAGIFVAGFLAGVLFIAYGRPRVGRYQPGAFLATPMLWILRLVRSGKNGHRPTKAAFHPMCDSGSRNSILPESNCFCQNQCSKMH